LIQTITDPILNDPTFLSIVRDGMTNGWSQDKMKEMKIVSQKKHAYIRVLRSGGYMLYKSPDMIITHAPADCFEKSCEEVTKYMKSAHEKMCATWVTSHISSLEKELDKSVDAYITQKGVSKDDINQATLKAIYDRVALLHNHTQNYAITKTTKTDNEPRENAVRRSGLLDKPDLRKVKNEAKDRVRSLLLELKRDF
jgi:hypothetical protein